MTRKEAIEQGYKFCGRAGLEWQRITDIEDLTEEDFKEDVWHLMDKEEQTHYVSKEDVADILAKQIADSEAWETGRDNDEVYDALLEIDYSGITQEINQVMEKFPTYKLTTIKLKQE